MSGEVTQLKLMVQTERKRHTKALDDLSTTKTLEQTTSEEAMKELKYANQTLTVQLNEKDHTIRQVPGKVSLFQWPMACA